MSTLRGPVADIQTNPLLGLDLRHRHDHPTHRHTAPPPSDRRPVPTHATPLESQPRCPHPRSAPHHPATMFERITFEPGKMGGRAVIRGLRITVGTVLALLADGCPESEILREYPDLQPEDLRQVLAYPAGLAREDVVAA